MKDGPSQRVPGCYIHKGWLPVSVFYKWIDGILELNEDGLFLLTVPLTGFVTEHGSMALFPPRTMSFRRGPIALPPTRAPDRNLTGTVKEGHYLLFRYDKPKKSFFPSWPALVSSNFKRRSRSASQTCTPSPSSASIRDTQTRIDVRMRDRCCMVTGQAAVRRTRGGNFTGLEVEHIFPLMAVGNPDWTSLMSVAAQQLVRTRKLADRPQNAILLRADIHSLFDDYQWNIWSEPGKPPTIARFEKSGATVLDPYDSVDFSSLTLSTTTSTASPSVELVRAHFRVALLIHVRGVGKRAAAGFNATQL